MTWYIGIERRNFRHSGSLGGHGPVLSFAVQVRKDLLVMMGDDLSGELEANLLPLNRHKEKTYA